MPSFPFSVLSFSDSGYQKLQLHLRGPTGQTTSPVKQNWCRTGQNLLEPHTNALAEVLLTRALPPPVSLSPWAAQRANYGCLKALNVSGPWTLSPELYRQLSEMKKVLGESIEEHILKFKRLVYAVDSALRRRMQESQVIEGLIRKLHPLEGENWTFSRSSRLARSNV